MVNKTNDHAFPEFDSPITAQEIAARKRSRLARRKGGYNMPNPPQGVHQGTSETHRDVVVVEGDEIEPKRRKVERDWDGDWTRMGECGDIIGLVCF